MKRISTIALLILLLSSLTPLKADEGMWLINLLDKNLAAQMKRSGLKINPKVIYDQDENSLSDAIVSLDFGCTGSIISQEGLLITNHHCAYGDIHSLSTPERNYLEEGFWAMERGEEIPIEGKSAYFLRKVIECTDEVEAVVDSLQKRGEGAGFRKVSTLIERKHNRESGMETMALSMWRGSKYYLFFYEVYSDIRLVGAPPVSIAAYGGDIDNWEWPQHKGDFALYRIYGDSEGRPAKYSKENRAITPKKVLNIATSGVKEGDFTMIMGFPGRTNRYRSSYGVEEIEKITNPISVKVKGEKLKIINSFMQQNPSTRLTYADYYFGVSNVQEYQEGEIYNFRRFGVVQIKREEERELQRWIESDSERREKYSNLLSEMEKSYRAVAEIVAQTKYYQETMVSGQGFIAIGNRINPLNTAYERENVRSLKPGTGRHKMFVRVVENYFNGAEMEVERELMNYQIREFLANVKPHFWGEYIEWLNSEFNGDSRAITNYLFENSIMLDKERFRKVVSEEQPITLFIEDPLYRLVKSPSIVKFRAQSMRALAGRTNLDLEGQYTRLLYQMKLEKGINQYPDANSTLRLTYGTVGSLSPSDAIYYSAQSTTQGLIDKYNPDSYEFNIKPEVLTLIKSREWGRWGDKGKLYVNFLSNNDITGGNSGSPVLNSRGNIVGLAFDGNKESLAGDAYFHPEMNKCVNVDIRYVLWIIEKQAKAGYLLDEMNFVKK